MATNSERTLAVQMKSKTPTMIVRFVSQMGTIVGVFSIGAFLVHLLVMAIDYYTYRGPGHMDLHNDFLGSVVSFSMVPMMVAYGMLSLIVFYVWRKMKHAMRVSYEHKMELAKQRAVLETAQRLTAITVEYIASNNAEIINWLEWKKRNQQQVSEKLEQASRRIGEGLRALSEVSFAASYYDKNLQNIEDYVNCLEAKLKDRCLRENRNESRASN